MRPPLEVRILVWILWTTQIVLSVEGVYVVEDPIPLVSNTGGNTGPNLEDTSSRTPIDQGNTESDNRRQDSIENMDNIEGPLSGHITTERRQVHCVELRSKRYISDGFCTSTRPITEVVCAGSCIPEDQTPWYADHIKVYGNKKRKEWRCVNDNVRQKKVTLLCDNNQTRTYRIKTVRTCKCKRLLHQHNESGRPNEDTSPRESSSNRDKRNRKNNRQWLAGHNEGVRGAKWKK